MTEFKIRAEISKDGSQRHSQMSAVKCTIEADSEEKAIERAKEIIIEKTGQTVMDIWIRVFQKSALFAPLDAIYTEENWGDIDLGKVA